MLILIGCNKDSTLQKLSDIDIVQLLNLRLEKDGVRFSFDDLDSGYYYFVSNLCSACLDEELSKIEKFNSLNDKKISLVLFDDELIKRLSNFIKITSLYKANNSLTDLNFVLYKKDPNEISLVKLETLIY